MEESLYHMAERFKSSPGTMTQEMCEDIDFLAERKGVDEVIAVEGGSYNDDEGRMLHGIAVEAGKNEDEWSSSHSDNDSSADEGDDEFGSGSNLWEAIEQSQLEISSQSQTSSQCMAPPPPHCPKEGNISELEIQAGNRNNEVTYSEAVKQGEEGSSGGDDKEDDSSPIVTLESFLDEEVEENRIGGGVQGDVDSARISPCEMVEICDPSRVEEENNNNASKQSESRLEKTTTSGIAIVESFFVEGTNEEQEEYEMSDDESLSTHDPMDPMEISVPYTKRD